MKPEISDQIIQKTLQEFEPEVDAGLWQRMEARLDAGKPGLFRSVWLRFSIPVAASLLLGFISYASYQVFRHQHEKTGIPQVIPVNKPFFSFENPSKSEVPGAEIIWVTPRTLGSLPMSGGDGIPVLTQDNFNYFSSFKNKDILPTTYSKVNSSLPVLQHKINREVDEGKNQGITTLLSNNLPNQQNTMPPAYLQNQSLVGIKVSPVLVKDSVKVIPANHSIAIPAHKEILNSDDTGKTDSSFVASTSEKEDGLTYQIVIPNVFTPNNDGVNDVFVIQNIERCTSSHLMIFNKKSKLVFEKQPYLNNWDAKQLPEDVYFYQFHYVLDGKEYTKNGTVSVIR